MEWIMLIVLVHGNWEEQVTYNEKHPTSMSCKHNLDKVKFRTRMDPKTTLVMGECVERPIFGLNYK